MCVCISNKFKLYKIIRWTKEIYEADLGGNAGRGRSRRIFHEQIGEVLEKAQVKRSKKPVGKVV
jgi:hypothetical protein